jgi:hypothetical protein
MFADARLVGFLPPLFSPFISDTKEKSFDNHDNRSPLQLHRSFHLHASVPRRSATAAEPPSPFKRASRKRQPQPGVNIIKRFFFLTYEWAKQDRMFVPSLAGVLCLAFLMFANKAGVFPSWVGS